MTGVQTCALPILPLVLCAILLCAVLWQGRELHSLRRTLTESAEALRSTEERLAALEERQPLASAFEVTGVQVNGEQKTLTAAVSVRLALEEEDVEFLACLPGLAYRSYLWQDGAGTAERNEEGVYAAELTVPLELDWPLEFTAVWNGGEETAYLGRVDSIAELLPVRLALAEGDVHYNKEAGMFYWCEWDFEFENGHGEPAEVDNPALRVYRNGSLEAENAAVKSSRDALYVDSEETTGLKCVPGDRMEFRLAYGDGSGLRYELPIRRWEVRESWEEERLLAGARPSIIK